MPFTHVRPNKGHRDKGGYAVEDVYRVFGAITPDIQHQANHALGADQNLADHQAAADASLEHAPSHECDQAPEPDCRHEEQHGQRQPVVDRDEGVQLELLLSVSG